MTLDQDRSFNRCQCHVSLWLPTFIIAEFYFVCKQIELSLYICINFCCISQELSKDTKITDDKGKEILALDIFAYFIKRLKDHLLSFMETKGLPVYIEDIYWVLPMPVPLILDISSIQFMTEAANKV